MRIGYGFRWGKHGIKVSCVSLVLAASMFTPKAAYADTTIEAVPAQWRLQQYGSNSAALYYTGSPCPSGLIAVSPSYTADDVNRFWSTVLMAKALGKVMGIIYNGSTPSCYLTSYYLKEG